MFKTDQELRCHASEGRVSHTLTTDLRTSCVPQDVRNSNLFINPYYCHEDKTRL